MTLDQLRYFLETAKTQHLNRAAQSLNISPSAVSSAIAALEEEYKCKLFDREGKSIRLTDKGLYLKVQAEKLFDQTSAIGLGLAGKETEFYGTYKVGGSHYLATHYLSNVWASVHSRFLNLSLEVGSMATHRVISAVLAGDLDGGLCMGPLNHPDLKIVPVFKSQMYIAARHNHPIFKLPTHQQIKRISGYPATIHKPVVGVDVCDNHPMFNKFGLQPKVRCFWDNDDTAVEMLKNSDSWTMLPDFVIQNNSKQIKSISDLSGWNAPNPVAFIYRSHRRENQVTGILIEETLKAFNQV
jgi:DNA-binding transcriptional LysR family regulator